MNATMTREVSKGDTDASGLRFEEELILVLGRALHGVGQPAHRLESMLVRVAGRLGVTVHVFSLPTGLLLSFERAGAAGHRLLGAAVAEAGRSRADAATDDRSRGLRWPTGTLLLASRSGADPEGSRPAARPLLRGRMATIAGFVLSATAFSVFFGGGVSASCWSPRGSGLRWASSRSRSASRGHRIAATS